MDLTLHMDIEANPGPEEDAVATRRESCGSGVINYSISDHLPVFVGLKVKAPKPLPHYITARSYKNYEPGAFTADLANQSDQLLSIFSCGDVDTKLNTLNDVVGSTLDLHAPVRTTRIRHRPCPFVSRGIKQLMKTRDLLHRNFFQSRDPSDWSKYKESRDTIKEILRETERNYTFLEVQQNKSNPSSLWKVINRVIPSKNKEPQRVYTKDLKTVADEFNVFFTSVGKTAALAASHLAEINNITWSEQQLPSPPAGDLFDFKRVSCEEVRRIISSLPLNKSPGPDKIHTRVYRDCLPVILGPLTEIINSSLESAKYPDAWKFAEVIPLLKEGDHEVASNNRPLSLLAVASKICDKVVLNQFSAYLFSNGRLSSHQSGNKKLHSTETLSLFMADHLLEAMDKKNLTALTLLDLSKAFDSLNHNKLLAKLSSVGASPHVLNWFKSYLRGRSQSVRINSILSDPLPITHGVPQGAILSPLLFCIYLNDLPCAPQVCGLESYVEGSKVFLSYSLPDVDTAIANLEQDLLHVAAWCCENQLLINPDKTKFMFIATRQLRKRFFSSPVVSFLGKSLEPVPSVKDLGVTLDSHLTYDCHIPTLCPPVWKSYARSVE